MCGIFGLSYGEGGASSEDWTPSEFMQIMFPAITHRGPHAYGWMYYDGEDVYYQKFEGRADTPEALDTMAIENEDKVQWLVCHVRWATHGSPDEMINNHPVRHGNIMGVHNGVIRNYKDILGITGREDDTCELDSEAIFAAIEKWGHRDGLRRIQGDMVTVYTNLEKPATLHIARSNGRPLETCRTEAGSFMFASECPVIDATGVQHSPFSSVSRHRLLRVRAGKVTERITLFTPDPVAARLQGGTSRKKFEAMHGTTDVDSWYNDRAQDRASKRGRLLFPQSTNPAVSLANQLKAQEERHEARLANAKRIKAVAADPHVATMEDHEQYQGFFKFKGQLLTEEAYMQAIVDSIQSGEDTSTNDERGA